MALRKIREIPNNELPVSVIDNQPTKPRLYLVDRLFGVVVLMLILESLLVGSLWTKVKYLEKNPTAAPAPGQTAQQPQPVTVTKDQVRKVFDDKVITFGDANSKLLLVEVADPSCPFCHAAAGHNPSLSKQMGPQFTLASDGGTYVSPVQEMKKLVDSGKAAFAYVYSNGHGNGEVAMKALYCAYDQNKFWQAHDKLMTSEGYDLINNAVKNDMSKSGQLTKFLGASVNGSELQSCLDSGKYNDRLQTEQQLAYSLGVSGTPGFFVNETNFAGAYSWTDMKSAAETALK